MSMKGERQLELERARREALRLEQVRAECRALKAVCESELSGVRDAAVQQYAAAELRELVGALREADTRVQDAPEATLEQLHGLQQQLTTTLLQAEARARSWSESQAQARARLHALKGRIEAVSQAQQEGAAAGLAEARRLVDEARTQADRGADDDAQRHLEQAEQALAGARTAALDEKVRREVVKGLLGTLKGMGFVIVGPQLSADVVLLEGRLPSGRRARFEVKLDGQLAFDLDGYEGRSCAQEMEKVETAMRNRFGVTMGPPQVVWKNPDRLSQGALELPGSGKSRSGR
jgi:hypothetical protein